MLLLFYFIFLFNYSILSVSSLYEDQIGKFDWVQRGIGSVHLAMFDESNEGSVKKLALASTHNVLAVVNTKNGELVWRQVLEEGRQGVVEALSVSAEGVRVVAGNPPLLRTFHSITAAVVDETPLRIPYRPPQGYTRLVVVRAGSGGVVVADLQDGAVDVHSLSSSTGEALTPQHSVPAPWLHHLHHQCGLSGAALVCGDGDSVHVLSLDAAERDFVAVDLQSLGLPPPLTAALPSERCGGAEAEGGIQVTAVPGTAQYLLIKSGDKSVVVANGDDGGLTVIKDVSTAAAVAVAGDDDDVIYEAVQQDNVVRVTGYDVTSGEELPGRSLSCSLPLGGEAVAGVRTLVVHQAARRGDGEVVVRALLVLADDSLHMIAPPGVVWSREEALASVVAVEAVDLPLLASSVAAMHEQMNTRGGLLSSFFSRVAGQAAEAAGWLSDVAERYVGGSGGLGGGGGGGGGDGEREHVTLTRDTFNLRKLLVVATTSGKVFGLDSWARGDVVWSAFLPSVRPLNNTRLLLFFQRSVAHFPHPPQMTLLARDKRSCDGVSFTFNPLTGEPVSGGLRNLGYRVTQASVLTQHDNNFLRPVLIVDAALRVHVYPEVSGEAVLLQHKRALYVTTRNDTHLSGHSLRFSRPGALSLSLVWSQQFPPGVITGVYGKRAGDKVHSPGRVMADRSVLYKYSNPNLAVVVSQGYDHVNKNTLGVYLVDLVSGAVVDWISHQRVSGPVHVMHSENWIVYAYYNDRHRRHEIQSLELYEGQTQHNATTFSSLSSPAQPPIVERQAFLLPQGVQAAAHTTTEKSITTKFLLMAMENGGVAQVARWLVDPRRPVSSAGPREESLMPYAPELPMPPTEVISYNRSLPRVTGIYAAPTGLESTCVVFVYGLDLFLTRVFPSKMFDMLKDDFDYWLIVVAVLTLVAAAVITKKLAQRKALFQAWK